MERCWKVSLKRTAHTTPVDEGEGRRRKKRIAHDGGSELGAGTD
jgi:hypothetical protein